jgi:drug/metabolite transporter (DMT)-like permease
MPHQDYEIPTKSSLILYPLILLQQILSALAFPIFKVGLNEFDPFVYAFYRFLFSTVVYAPILVFLFRRRKMPAKVHVRILVIGMILILLNQAAFMYGQSLTTAGHSSLLFATIPIFIYILAVIFLKEKATFRRTLGIIVAAVGVYIILSNGSISFGREYLIGDLIILVAVLAWAVVTIMLKPLAIQYGAFRVTGLAIVYGSLVYLPFGFYRALSFDHSPVTTTGWISIFYVAVVVSVLAYFLWYWLLKYMEASRLAIAQNIQPIIATGVAAVYLSEPVTASFVLGGIIVIGGVIITEA